jgi:hypothetical protein
MSYVRTIPQAELGRTLTDLLDTPHVLDESVRGGCHEKEN